ncbi:hypothetical protein B9H04_06765 [Halorubrum ezzemoulense DSM 17463]|uniref:Winged helix-turn-helix transcription repressor HrcA DNA-binding domain-containing protein n=1 Tax=Halorubrum ezzemoulense DSM 17463 TaxID=1121945 RepID=A0A1X4H8I3_HALEZ|nr:hypothetical protein B9H04_06765 [Halorubrum ezzemoulense DSM 17463]
MSEIEFTPKLKAITSTLIQMYRDRGGPIRGKAIAQHTDVDLGKIHTRLLELKMLNLVEQESSRRGGYVPTEQAISRVDGTSTISEKSPDPDQLELTSSQTRILSALINRYINGLGVSKEDLAIVVSRNPEKIRSQMQSLKALQLVEESGQGYIPKGGAYEQIDVSPRSGQDTRQTTDTEVYNSNSTDETRVYHERSDRDGMCSQCGDRIANDEAKYCPSCGAEL